ncbi:MAG: putative lipid II flippase FtsW [Burkholderiales bacterium]
MSNVTALTGRARPAVKLSVSDYDLPLVWLVLLMLGFGMVMVYSASIAIAEVDRFTGHRSSYFLTHHAMYVALGVTAGYAAFQIPLRVWQRIAPYLFLCSVLLLAIVLVPAFGREINGSRRWLSFGVLTLQPSEFVKLFVVLYAADYTVRKAALIREFTKGFLPILMVMLLTGGLLLLEPDFGGFAVTAAIAMAILFLGGVNAKHFFGLLSLLFVGLALLIWTSPYRMQRIVGFMDPWADPFGSGYQLSHALIAFGRGEWFGVGLGASVEKLLYLPEAHTDFLPAVIAEELGFTGIAAVIGAFAWLVMRAFSIARQSQLLDRPFGALCAYGIGVWFGVQGAVNVGVNMGILPTKGLTLPLLSYGGSGILVNCLAMAVLLRAAWENRQMMKGYTV